MPASSGHEFTSLDLDFLYLSFHATGKEVYLICLAMGSVYW